MFEEPELWSAAGESDPCDATTPSGFEVDDPDACGCQDCNPPEPAYLVDFPSGTAALGAMQECARAENIAAARKVLTAACFARRGFERDVDLFGEEAEYRAGRSAEMETSLALAVTPLTAERYVTVGNALDSRLPLIRKIFVDGRVDYPRVYGIVEATADICDATLALMEPHLADVAVYLTPKKLGVEVMRELIRTNPDEAEAIRKERRLHTRKVSVTPDLHGMAQVYATLTSEEGRALDSLVHEMAATVCKEDPRSIDNLRTDAFMALVHGESYLHCQCGRDDCPTAHLPRPERPKPEVHIHVDLETLLRLADDPAHMDGHGPTDPELARLLAEDATWQAIVEDARKVAASGNAVGNNANEAGESYGTEAGSDIAADVEGEGEDSEPDQAEGSPTQPADKDSDREPQRSNGSGTSSAPTRYRTRRRPAGQLPPKNPDSEPTTPPPRGPQITDILDAVKHDPTLLDGQFPDGHGGHLLPPPGALTYRPRNAVRAAVFDKYDTCTFPGCPVRLTHCQFDHLVEFDHHNPGAGGWSIETNGHPACTRHHQAKTDRQFRVVRLDGDVIVWIGQHGAIGVTLPLPPHRRPSAQTPEPKQPPTPKPKTDPPPPPEPDDPIYQPTWWETHMHPGDLPPTLADLASVTDEQLLRHGEQLRANYAEHRAITDERARHQPPPF